MIRLLAILPLALAFCSSAPAAISLAFSPGFPVNVGGDPGDTLTIDIVATSSTPLEDISLGNADLSLTGGGIDFTFGATGTDTALIALTPTAGIGALPVTVATFTVDINAATLYNTFESVSGTFTSVDLTPGGMASVGAFSNTQGVAAIPEPSSLALLAFCGAGVVARRRRR